MNPKKAAEQNPVRPATAATVVTTTTSQRKPWHKRTPIQVIIDQIDKVRDEVAEKEEELKQAKKQLQKLEEVQKALESS